MTPMLGPAAAPDGCTLLVAALAGPGYPRARHMQRTRLVVDDFGCAVAHERRCSSCGRWLPLDFRHFWPGEHGGLGMGYRCHACSRVSNRVCHKRDPEDYRTKARRRYRAQVERDPEWHARKTARDTERNRARRKQQPERYREYDRRYRERVRNDPARYAERLEMGRIDRRLRAIDAGKTPPPGQRSADDHSGGRLPVAPLLPLIDELLVRADGDVMALSNSIGTTDRTLRRWWERPETSEVQLDTADRILLDCNLLWWEVWSEGQPGHERASELFTGEKVAA